MIKGISFNTASVGSSNRVANGNSQQDVSGKFKNMGVTSAAASQDTESTLFEGQSQRPEGPPPNDGSRPEPPQGGGNEDQAPPELQAKLTSLGVPADVISQGREAVMSYCQENNITMPEPPDRGSKLNVSG